MVFGNLPVRGYFDVDLTVIDTEKRWSASCCPPDRVIRAAITLSHLFHKQTSETDKIEV
jgi:hypothetical protein